MLKGERPLDHTGTEKHAILRIRAWAAVNPHHRPLHDAPLQRIGPQRAEQRNQAGSRRSRTANIRSAHIRSSAGQRRNGRQRLKDGAGQDFGQDALQRAVSAIHRQQGHALASQAGQRRGYVGTRPRRHLHDLGRVPEGLPERGRGSRGSDRPGHY